MFPWSKPGQFERSVYRALDDQSLTNTVNNRANIAVRPVSRLASVTGQFRIMAGPFAFIRGRPSNDLDDVYVRLDRPTAVRNIDFTFQSVTSHNGGTLTSRITPRYTVGMNRFPYRLKKPSENKTEVGYWLGGSNSDGNTVNSGDKGVFITAEQLTSLGDSISSVKPAVRSTAGDCDTDYYFSEVLDPDEVVSELVFLISTKSGSYSWGENDGYHDGDVLCICGTMGVGN